MPMHNVRLHNTSINILYEDNHLLVVGKPAGLLSQGDSSSNEHVQGLMKHYLAGKYNKPGNVFLALVQRLDRPVGGAMVLARTSKAASRLSEQLRNRTVQKEYLAVVQGCGFERAKTHRLEHYLLKNEQTRMAQICDQVHPEAKRAWLDFEVVAQEKTCTLLSIRLLSGRFHQIRAQLSASNMPIVGDIKYGYKGPTITPGTIALWCDRLAFQHPTTGESLQFVCLPPLQLAPWSIFKGALEP